MSSIRELVENFSFFDEWTDRYRYLIDLGRKIPEMDSADKTEGNKVRGCQSQVWMVMNFDAAEGTLSFDADSDSAIVKGLIAILLALYGGTRPEEIMAADIDGTFSEIGLDSHLSPNRRNGFYSMVNRIKASAVEHIKG